MKRIILKNHKGEDVNTTVHFDRLGKIRKLMIAVIGGDEVLFVIHKDGRQKVYDTGPDRTFDEFNYRYMLYDSKNPNPDIIEDFINRSDTMDMQIYAAGRR